MKRSLSAVRDLWAIRGRLRMGPQSSETFGKPHKIKESDQQIRLPDVVPRARGADSRNSSADADGPLTNLTNQPPRFAFLGRFTQQGVRSIHWETLFIATVVITISSMAAWAIVTSLILWIACSPPSLWCCSNGEKQERGGSACSIPSLQ